MTYNIAHSVVEMMRATEPFSNALENFKPKCEVKLTANVIFDKFNAQPRNPGYSACELQNI